MPWAFSTRPLKGLLHVGEAGDRLDPSLCPLLHLLTSYSFKSISRRRLVFQKEARISPPSLQDHGGVGPQKPLVTPKEAVERFGFAVSGRSPSCLSFCMFPPPLLSSSFSPGAESPDRPAPIVS